jgi:hypothetical protein
MNLLTEVVTKIEASVMSAETGIDGVLERSLARIDAKIAAYCKEAISRVSAALSVGAAAVNSLGSGTAADDTLALQDTISTQDTVAASASGTLVLNTLAPPATGSVPPVDAPPAEAPAAPQEAPVTAPLSDAPAS